MLVCIYIASTHCWPGIVVKVQGHNVTNVTNVIRVRACILAALTRCTQPPNLSRTVRQQKGEGKMYSVCIHWAERQRDLMTSMSVFACLT